MLAVVTRSAVANLAGVPSIVFGLFGLGFFIQFVGRVDRPRDAARGRGACGDRDRSLWAALTLALLTLPTVIVATEEALRTVPWEQREASLALGATRWETIRRVVLPGARPGHPDRRDPRRSRAARARSRRSSSPAPRTTCRILPASVTDQFMHLGYHVLILSTQSPDVEATKPMLYGTVFVLLALTFLLNLTGVLIRARTRCTARDGR